jgi:predicted nucleic acid-binding protein
MEPTAMKRLGVLRGKRNVVLDSMVFIYLFENDLHRAGLCQRLLEDAGKGIFSGVITPITAAEVLVKPLMAGRNDIAEDYRIAMRSLANVRLVPLSVEAGFMAGALRAKYGLPLPDMIQAAVSMEQVDPILVTNDRHLLRVQETRVLLLDDMSE